MQDTHPNLSVEHQALLYRGTSVTGALLLGIIVRICFRCWKKRKTPKIKGSQDDQFYRKIPKRQEEATPLRRLEISSPLPPPQVDTTSSTFKGGADQPNGRITQGHSTAPSQINGNCDVELGRDIHGQRQTKCRVSRDNERHTVYATLPNPPPPNNPPPAVPSKEPGKPRCY